MKYYAGIGSRETPETYLEMMAKMAGFLAKLGYVLRSGVAEGADKAFEQGADAFNGKTEIWLPWRNFNSHPDTGLYPTPRHFDVASTLHPVWDRLSGGARALHARNVGQVLGMDLQTPVEFVVCWTPDGCADEAGRTPATGGTATAIVLASRNNIPVWNLYTEKGIDFAVNFLKRHKH